MIKYILAISAVSNGTLLMFVAGVLPFLLFLSAVVILCCVWYIRRLLKTIDDFNSDLAVVFNSVDHFSDLLNNIYSMEVFYGEPVLEELIKTSTRLNNQLIDYQEKYSLDVVDVANEEAAEEEIVYGEEEKE